MPRITASIRSVSSLLVVVTCLASIASAQDEATLGGGTDRNMASEATGLITSFDPKSGANVKWVATLGSEAYGSPVVAGDRVFVGTNNGKPRVASVEGDQGVLMAFDAGDGSFLWQRAHAKLATGAINDWPLQGVCGTPTVVGDRVYYVSNRGELLALAAADGKVAWTLDMIDALGVHPHHMTVTSPLALGDRLFLHTSHGVDEAGAVPHPEAPSFLAVARATGTVAWQDASPGAGILDGQWSSPSFGVDRKGREQVVFPGGDGWVYAFSPAGEPLWRFDANRHRQAPAGESPPRDNLIGSAVFHDGRVFVATGHDPELGAGEGKLWALDASGSGELGDDHVVWSYAAEGFSRTLSTPAIADGLLYLSDLNGFVHCLDVATGEALWAYDTFAAIWSSPVVADGKVYIGDEDGDLAILAAGREEKELFEGNLGNAIYASPTAHDGVLYVATRSKLFALGQVDPPKPAATDSGS